MRKIRLATAALVALLVAVPAVASAAGTYRSNLLKDPVGDVTSYSSGRPVSDPSIDIYKMIGYRYAKYFVVTASFKHLTPATYTHRFVAFADTYGGDETRSTIIDMSVGSNGSRPTPKVVILKLNTATGASSYYDLHCVGAKASPDYSSGRVTYTLPTYCFKNYDQSEAAMVVVTGRFSARAWRASPFDSYEPYNNDGTDADDLWAWDRSITPATAARGGSAAVLDHLGF